MENIVDTLIFAPLAPISGVLLFWFIQLLFIESQKYLLSKIRGKHEALCRFTNFLGIFFQTLCHALGYTVTGSGIAEFYLSVDYGKVSPRKKKTGFFEWFANGFLFLGPFFIPPMLIMICLLFLIRNLGFLPTREYTFSQGLIDFGANLYIFSRDFLGFIASIDLFHPGHIGFLILMVFLGLGIRPSYIRDERREEKIDMLYDLRNIKNHLIHKPIYVVSLIFTSYIFFYLSHIFRLNWYIAFYSLLGWLSIIAIVALLITHLIIVFIKVTDRLDKMRRLILYVTMIASYTSLRVLFLLIPIPYATTLSLLGMCLSVVGVTMVIMRQTNKFKTIGMMKPSLHSEDGDLEWMKKNY